MKLQQSSRKSMILWLWLTLTCVFIFLVLVLAIRQPSVQAIDNRLIQLLDPIRKPAVIAFFTKITDFGSSNFLNPLIVLFMIYLLFRKKILSFILLPAVYLLERGANEILKNWVMRDRPDLPHLVHATGFSFPSGHAMNASSVYGMLILLILPLIRKQWARYVWAAINLTMILLIGFSRPFLRVHYFTDIWAGYCAGVFFVALSAIALIFVYNRKR